MKKRGYVIVTGATGAIGREIARGLLHRGHDVILACRNEQRADKLADKLLKEFPKREVKTIRLDLADDLSVAEAASVLKQFPILGVINNAGVMNRRYGRAPGGMESTICVNYANTVMFNEMLIDSIKPGGVLVFTTSLTRFLWRPDSDCRKADSPIEPRNVRRCEVEEKNFSQLGTYGLSKRLITDYAAALSKRLANREIRVNCADPGIVNSGMITMHRWYDRLADILFRPFIRSPRNGAKPALRAFASSHTGRIFCRWNIRKV